MTTSSDLVDGHVAGHLVPGGVAPRGERLSPGVRIQQHRLPTTYAAFAALPAADAGTVAGVTQVLSLVGHLVDNRLWDELDAVFGPDVVIGPLTGLDAVVGDLESRDALPSHHTVNTLVRLDPAGGARSWSRYVTISGDGSVATADVLDTFVHLDGDWRIAHRVLLPRHAGPSTSDDGVTPWVG